MHFSEILKKNKFLIVFLISTFAGFPLMDYSHLPSVFVNIAVYYPVLIYTVWYFHVKDRLCDKKAKNTMSAVYTMIMLLKLLMMLRYVPFTTYTLLKQYLWFFYYGPILAVSTLVFLLCVSLITQGKKERRIKIICFSVSGLLFSLFATNDLHHLVFKHDDVSLPLEASYSYGPVFFITYVWIILQFAAFYAIIIRYSGRLGFRRAAVAPAMVIAGYLSYSLLFFLGKMPSAYTPVDMFIVFVILGLETAIKNGLFPVNSGYQEIFAKAPAGAAIYNKNGEIVYASENYFNIDYSEKNTVSRSLDISGGSFNWKEDVTAVNELINELNEINSALSEDNELITYENRENVKKAKYETKNRILDEVSNSVKDKTEEIENLLKTDISSPYFNKSMRKICVLMSYIKRRADFAVTGFDRKTMNIRELYTAVNETARYMSKCGLNCRTACSSDIICETELLAHVLDVFGNIVSFSVKNDSDISFDITDCGNGNALAEFSASEEAFKNLVIPEQLHAETLPGRIVISLPGFITKEATEPC